MTSVAARCGSFTTPVKTYKEEVSRISAEAMIAHRNEQELGYKKDAKGKK